MKIKIDIDCRPEEARAFLGLPDVKPMQEELLKEIQQRMTDALKVMNPEAMLKTWLPATIKGFEQLQEILLSQIGSAKRPDK
jgi:hypothetical protein